ncbi:MAG TPA: PAS domain-containing protein [Beijerinckiaceae bacterium]|nr:PAS domain-containing protein [Beijerinckiaceae bacterium]
MNRFVKRAADAGAQKLSPSADTRQAKPTLPQVGTWEWDFSTGAFTWSDGVYRLLGLAPGSAPASYDLLMSKVHPDDRVDSEAARIAALSKGTAINSEFRILRPDGEIRWLANKGELFANAAGKPSWAAGALFDITDIREAQLDLAAREERYRALATVKALGEWRADSSGELIEAKFWTAFTGQSDEEFAEHGWLKAVHPDDAGSISALWHEALRLGCGVEFTYRVRHRCGDYRWVRTKAVPLKNPDGSVREWIGSDEDITPRREAEENLRVNENRLRLALEAARTITWDYDIGTGHITRSQNAPQVLGFGSGPVEDFFNRIHPEDSIRLREALRRTLELGERYDVEFRVIERCGRTRWLHARGEVLQTAHKRPDRMIGVTFDITSEKEANLDQRRAREELDDMTARLHALGQATGGGFVWTSDPTGQVSDDMEDWRAFTGQSPKDVQGWGWLNAVHPADRERVREVMQQLIDTQGPHAVDYRLRHHSGEYRWFRYRAAPVLRRDRTVAEWIGMCEPLRSPTPRDVSDAPGPAGFDEQPQLISGCQVRAARAIVGWSVRDLAEASGVSGSTIRRVEEDGGLPETRDTRKLDIIRRTLEEAGVVFLPAPDGKGGVRPV